MEPVTQAGIVSRFLRALPDLIGKVITSLAHWYWRIPLLAQFFVALAAVPLLRLALIELGIEGGSRENIVSLFAVLLVATMIAATLAHGHDGKREK